MGSVAKDTIKVTCIVDNAVQTSSQFWGEHGLSFLIETAQGHVLFDTGQTSTVLLHNLQVAGVDPAAIAAIALSHAHYDHTGGLNGLLQDVSKVPLYAHPDLFRERFSRHGAEVKSIGLPLSREELTRYVNLQLHTEPQQIVPGVYTSGEIVSRTELEGRSTRHLVRSDNAWVADPYRDDMAIVLKIAQGLVLICGCCHAGLLNTLQHVQVAFGERVTTVLGGMHLAAMSAEQLRHIIRVLQGYDIQRLYPNHCTGQNAYVALSVAFGDRVLPCPVGTELTFHTR